MSAVAQLSDQEDRTRIERALDETLFVEAGAGTGKTHQLVERIVNLIASGRVDGSGIAAITFTEKAAAELRDRILERLEEESDDKTDRERQRRCQAALEDLDSAAIEPSTPSPRASSRSIHLRHDWRQGLRSSTTRNLASSSPNAGATISTTCLNVPSSQVQCAVQSTLA